MFNSFPLFIYEQFHQKKLPVLLGESTDVGERTWRDRLSRKWQPTKEDEDRVSRIATRYLIRELSKGGLSKALRRELISAAPPRQTEAPLLTADLIYWFSLFDDNTKFQPAIDLAIKFDQYCHAFSKATRSDDVDGFRLAGLEALTWLKGFGPFTEQDLNDIKKKELQLSEALSLEELRKPVADVAESMILHVFSCWDVLFCHHYFAGQASAYPLFELMMPRFSPTIEIDKETGKLSRDGKPPKRGIFETSSHRLLDFVALLISRRKNRRFPDGAVSVSQMSAFFGVDERRLVKWRTQETHLSGKQFDRLWRDGLAYLSADDNIATPWPLLIVAYLWGPLLVREENEPVSITNCMDGYRDWWQRNLVRLQAEGLTFGDEPWPAWLIDQSSGSRSLDAWRSSQSSGLSSHPRDSQ